MSVDFNNIRVNMADELLQILIDPLPGSCSMVNGEQNMNIPTSGQYFSNLFVLAVLVVFMHSKQ